MVVKVSHIPAKSRIPVNYVSTNLSRKSGANRGDCLVSIMAILNNTDFAVF